MFRYLHTIVSGVVYKINICYKGCAIHRGLEFDSFESVSFMTGVGKDYGCACLLTLTSKFVLLLLTFLLFLTLSLFIGFNHVRSRKHL